MKEGESIAFEQLLVKLKVIENEYRLAVGSFLNAPTVFLKRKPNELRINNYNPACLEAWRANMDILCATYLVSYIFLQHKKE